MDVPNARLKPVSDYTKIGARPKNPRKTKKPRKTQFGTKSCPE